MTVSLPGLGEDTRHLCISACVSEPSWLMTEGTTMPWACLSYLKYSQSQSVSSL